MKAPAENVSKKSEPSAAPQPLPEGAASRRILVVDDDPAVRESLRKVLKAEGYAVTLAADDREAVERFNAERIDLVLLDLNLPVNSGWDTFGTLTAIDPLRPIIIITGRQNQFELAAAAGVSALMVKPLNVPRLLQWIADLLAEEPAMRLKRLVGVSHDFRYVPPLTPKRGAASPVRRSIQDNRNPS